MTTKDPKRFTYVLSREEIIESFIDQISDLRRACFAYDDGNLREAKNIALKVHIICHDNIASKRSKSILSLLNLKREIFLPDTSTIKSSDPRVASSGPPLLVIGSTDTGWEVKPPLGAYDDVAKSIAFSEWWDGIVYCNSSGLRMSRKFLILSMRNQHGGAHVDSTISDEAYFRFMKFGDHISISKNGDVGISLPTDHPLLDASNLHLKTVRQIGHELLSCIDSSEIIQGIISKKVDF